MRFRFYMHGDIYITLSLLLSYYSVLYVFSSVCVTKTFFSSFEIQARFIGTLTTSAMADEQQQFFLKWNDFQSNMVSSFKHLRDEKSFTDVTLACDGQTCKAHKMVLSACSPYFKSLLEVCYHSAM